MKRKGPKILKPAKRGVMSEARIKDAVKKVISMRENSKKCQVSKINCRKEVDYPVEGELYDRIIKLVHEYDNEISMPASMGVVRLVGKYLEDIEV